MQKQKIDPLFLILHSDYDSVFCGLYNGSHCQGLIQEPKLTASKNLMVRCNELLAKYGASWTDLTFIGVNQGPSPFTTLRVVITTINGLLFSHKTPLVGVDGLQTFVKAVSEKTSGPVVTLLNAFNKDLYFAIKQQNGSIEVGWEFYATFLDALAKKFSGQQVTFVGNAVALYRDTINNFFPRAHIPEPLPTTVSLHEIALQALAQWNEGCMAREPLLPLYLKTLEYKSST